MHQSKLSGLTSLVETNTKELLPPAWALAQKSPSNELKPGTSGPQFDKSAIEHLYAWIYLYCQMTFYFLNRLKLEHFDI